MKPSRPKAKPTRSAAKPAGEVRGILGAIPVAPTALPAVLLVVALIFIGSAESENFLSSFNISNVLVQVTPLLLVALGQTFVVASGGLDLAVGGTVSLVTVVIATTAGDLGIVPAILVGAGAGLIVGVINGIGVAFGLDSFLTTLATFSLAQGTAFLILEKPGGEVPDGFTDIAGFFGGPGGTVPVALPIVLIVALIAATVLLRSRLGTHILAVGSNRQVASLCGVHDKRTLVGAYVLSAAACVLAGIFLTARLAGGDPTGGSTLTLDSLAVVVLGGTLLAGGRATAFGTVVAAFAVGLLPNVLNMARVPDYWQTPAKGIVVIAAVAIPSLVVMAAIRRRRRSAAKAIIRGRDSIGVSAVGEQPIEQPLIGEGEPPEPAADSDQDPS